MVSDDGVLLHARRGHLRRHHDGRWLVAHRLQGAEPGRGPLPELRGHARSGGSRCADDRCRDVLVGSADRTADRRFILVVTKRDPKDITAALKEEWQSSLTLAGTVIVLGVAWWLSANWSDFYTRAHGFAAVGMFILLIRAIAAVALGHRQEERDRVWFRWYAAVAVLMAVGGVAIWATRVFGDHTVFALEAYEIALFAFYWVLQTLENWWERVEEVDGQSTPPQVLEGALVK